MDTARATELLAAGSSTFSVPGAQLGLLRGGERFVACAGRQMVDNVSPVRRETTLPAGSIAALRREDGDAFVVEGDPPGGMTIAFDDDLLCAGPFAVPRNG
ncbi:hypothetical protein [Humibacillus xanthopallidus]|uniref:hypothetical protein n=1 Tax=Humibacillus xanthopallidus TaxID=412689 RepID=UPI00384D86FB